MAISRTRLLMMGIGDPATCHALTCRTRVVGDPGLRSFLRTIGGSALSMVPGGGLARTALRGTGSLIRTARARAAAMLPPGTRVTGGQMPIGPVGAGGSLIASGLKGLAVATIGGVIGRRIAMRQAAGAVTPIDVMRGRRHRRMHVTNVKALRRSTRRLAGFHKLALHVESQLSHLVRRRTRGKFFGRKK